MTLVTRVLGPSERRSSRYRGTWIAALAIAAVLLAISVTAYAALDSTSPVMWNDETGYLSGAQILAGVGEPRDLGGRGYYYMGWSFLLVPLWWISTDPEVVYRLAVTLSAALSIATIVPLTFLGIRFGLSKWVSVFAAAIVITGPARTVQASLAQSESLLTFLIALSALLAMRFAAQQTTLNAALLLFFATWIFATHGRFISVLIAAIIWTLVSRWRSWKSTATLLLATAAAAAGNFLLYRSVSEQLYRASSDRESVGIARIFSTDTSAVTITGAGQLWYIQVAWLGLAVTGLWVIARFARIEWRRKQASVASWAVVAMLGAAVLSITWLSTRIGDGTARLDMFTYGRYLDPATTTLAFLGAVWILRGVTRKDSLVIAGLQVASIGVFALAATLLITQKLEPDWVPTSVAGLLALSWPLVTAASCPPWIAGSLIGLGAALTVLLLRRRAIFFLVILAMAFGTMSVLAEVRSMRPFFGNMYESFTLRESIEAIEPESISFDVVGLSGDTVSRNSYQFWLAPQQLLVFDSSITRPDTEYVIARTDWTLGEQLGAELVAVDSGSFDNALWRLP
jgi:hypothetical protein